MCVDKAPKGVFSTYTYWVIPKMEGKVFWAKFGVRTLVVLAAFLLVYCLLLIKYIYFSSPTAPALQQATNTPTSTRPLTHEEVLRSATASGGSSLSAQQEQELIQSTTAR
jgi:hypothetical protein